MAGTNPKSVHDFHRYIPKKDDFGKVGHKEKRWHEGHFVSLFANPWAYASTMTGHETFTDPLTPLFVYVLDPNGSDREFRPSGTFRGGFMAFIKNRSRENHIIFDPTGKNTIIGPGELGIEIVDDDWGGDIVWMDGVEWASDLWGVL